MRRMERRDFVKFCAASALASAGPGAVAADSTPRFYSRARLVDEKGAPILAKAIPANRNLIFHYPFAATPCFLLNLGRPASTSVRLKTAANEAYEWKGGVGAGRVCRRDPNHRPGQGGCCGGHAQELPPLPAAMVAGRREGAHANYCFGRRRDRPHARPAHSFCAAGAADPRCHLGSLIGQGSAGAKPVSGL